MENLTGQKVREIRESRKLTREAFAKLVGYSAVHIYKIEAGLRPVPKRLILLLDHV